MSGIPDTISLEGSQMPKEILFLVEESPEGGFEAQAPGYSIFTQGETIEELKVATIDAVRCHFEDAERPRLVRCVAHRNGP